jgi:hypothetical protein
MPAVAESDPTMDFVRRLSDESQWVIVRNAPIMMPHVRYVPRPDGTDQRIEVTESDLPALAEKIRRLWEDYGVPMRITPGHIDPKKPEVEQPPIYGFGVRPHLGRFGPKGLPAVLADLCFKPECYDDAKTYPYRSAELYPDTMEIHGIALLRRDPFLNLGMVGYEADHAAPDRHQRPQEPAPMPAVLNANGVSEIVTYCQVHNCSWEAGKAAVCRRKGVDPARVVDMPAAPDTRFRQGPVHYGWELPHATFGDDGVEAARTRQALSMSLKCPHYSLEMVLAICRRGLWDRPADIGETRQILELQNRDPLRRTFEEALAELRGFSVDGFDPRRPEAPGAAVPMPPAADLVRAPTEPWLTQTNIRLSRT